MTSNSIMHALKRAVPPSRTVAAEFHPPANTPYTLPESTLFTRYVLDNLELEANEHRMLVMTFAPQIQTDCDAKVLDFDEYYHLLGTEKRNGLRILKRTFESHEILSLNNEQNSVGRPRDVYLLSVNQFEEVLLAANTDSGKKWRKLVLKIKNLVVNYMKMEMDASAKWAREQLEEQSSKLAIEEAKRLELETAHAGLQATLDAEKERRSAMKALRDAEDEPRQTAYLMESGVHRSYVKIGKTGEDGGEKRKKELQTGNPEEITVLFEMKCVDSKLVERNLHHIFRWYKRRGEWYEIDKERAIYMMRMIVNLLDGLRQVEHDEEEIVEACQRVLNGHALLPPATSSADTDEEELQNVESKDDDDKFKTFLDVHIESEPDRDNKWLSWDKVRPEFREWYKKNGDPKNTIKDADIKAYLNSKLGSFAVTTRKGVNVRGWFGWRLKD